MTRPAPRRVAGLLPAGFRPVGALPAAAVLLATALALGACTPTALRPLAAGVIRAVGAENQYANVISQIGGRYVAVSAVESNPNTDPHSFEASVSVAREIASAGLVVQNGLGYDSWAGKLEAASPDPRRKIINVAHLLRLPSDTPNPHLWYAPSTMPAVAAAIARDLATLTPAHAAYFQANVRAFDASLLPWLAAIQHFRAAHPATPVAVTEPVGDYLLEAAGCDIRTPFSFQAAIMNGTDPAPQDVATEQQLLTHHGVTVFVYNQQVTGPLTQSFERLARARGVPIVGVYETMPTGYDYQSWMLAELDALTKAVTSHTSTTQL